MSDVPKYRQIAASLRDDITAGHLRPGDQMPTKARLMADTGVALGTVDRALAELRQEGLIRSEQGHGIFVARVPDPPADLPGQLDALRGGLADLRGEVAGPMVDRVAALEANLMDLYAKLGFEYPHDGAAEAQAPKRRRAAGA
jgi:DNA-binding transcriptional MocR family regulator